MSPIEPKKSMTQLEKERCNLCLASSGTEGNVGRVKLENSQLYSTANFVVLPALGPLEPGHIIVASRRHYPSLAFMGMSAILEYQKMTKYLINHQPFYAKGYLEVEHGSTENECAGSCIPHTHVHWIPGFGEFAAILEGSLPRLAGVSKLSDLDGIRTPYIYINGEGDFPRFYQAFGVEPQFIRQRLCEEIGLEDWDWRLNPNFEWIRKTISFWVEVKS